MVGPDIRTGLASRLQQLSQQGCVVGYYSVVCRADVGDDAVLTGRGRGHGGGDKVDVDLAALANSRPTVALSLSNGYCVSHTIYNRNDTSSVM